MSEVPMEVVNIAQKACESLLPQKSKLRYEKAYKGFSEWRLCKNVVGVSVDIMLAFFYEKSQTFKSSTLWSLYSMIKSNIMLHENIDISKYAKLIGFLKRSNDSYVAVKSKVFTMINVQQFLREASNEEYLFMKVVLIFGLNGACHKSELYQLKCANITDTGSIAVVTLNDTKTKLNRTFTVTSDCDGYALYKQYAKLRPEGIKHDRFFIHFKKGKCSVTPVGINIFASIPKEIAKYLKLPEFQKYTGHALRRTSATLLADNGVDIQILKRHGGWRSNSTAEGYIERSIFNKVTTSKKIFEQADKENEIAINSKEIIAIKSSDKLTETTTVIEPSLPLTEAPAVKVLLPLSETPILNNTSCDKQMDNIKSAAINFSNLNNCNFNNVTITMYPKI